MNAFFLLLAFLAPSSPFVDGSVKDIYKKAEADKKLIFVDVYTDWCGPCKLMDRTTFKDERVQSLLTEKVVAYKINAEKGEGVGFAKKFKVRAYPAFLILDSKGKIVDRKYGYLPPQNFLNWITQAIE